MDKDTMNTVTTVASNMILLGIILCFILAGFLKKVNVYDAFIEGAKEGFTTAVKIIPYLVAILVGIGVFRASGAMDMVIQGISWSVEQCGLNADFVGALPTAIMKPLSGNRRRGQYAQLENLCHPEHCGGGALLGAGAERIATFGHGGGDHYAAGKPE